MNEKMNKAIKVLEWGLDLTLRPVTFTNNVAKYIVKKTITKLILEEAMHTVTYEDGKEVID